MARVLLVEDEGAIAQTIEFALREDGFECAHALTGRDALRLAATTTFDRNDTTKTLSSKIPSRNARSAPKTASSAATTAIGR